MKYPAIVGLMLLAACEANPFRALAPQWTPLAAPASFREWYKEIEACSGIRGDFDAIRFYTMKDITVDGVPYNGYWNEVGNTIVLRTDMLERPRVVKHEEMHALLRTTKHPTEFFNGVCGDLLTA